MGKFIILMFLSIIPEITSQSVSPSTIQPFNRTECPKSCLNEICNIEKTECIDGCVAGFYGSNCSYHCAEKCANNTCIQNGGRCKSCINHWFGEICTERCYNCPNGCDQDTGICKVFATQSVLPLTTQPLKKPECPKSCLNENCNDENTECLDGCVAGLYGRSCSYLCAAKCANNECFQNGGRCKSCIEHWFGDSCTERCCNCQKGCDQDTGICNEMDDGKCVLLLVCCVLWTLINRSCSSI